MSIQRNFLWGGNFERKTIAWVRWGEVCKPKKSGGLGIKDLQLFNLSLLGKWLWRIVGGEKALWLEVLNLRYGVRDSGMRNISCIQEGTSSSVWWRDLCSIERENHVATSWFNQEDWRGEVYTFLAGFLAW